MISVIVPMYNAADHLPELLKCLDVLQDVEVLFIDDGSTDDSAKLAANWGHGRIVHQEHLGVAAARRRGIKEATGDWIWFVDADDTFDTHALQRMRAASDGVDLVVCRAHHYDPLGRIRVMEGVADEIVLDDIKPAIFSGTIRGYLWNKLFRTEVLRNAVEASKDRELLTSQEDFMLLLDALPWIQKTRLIPFIGYHYKDRGSTDRGTGLRQLQNTAICADRAVALGAPPSFRVWFHAVPSIATVANLRIPSPRKVQVPLLKYLTPSALAQTWSAGHRREALHGAVMAVTVPIGVYSPLYRAGRKVQKIIARFKC